MNNKALITRGGNNGRYILIGQTPVPEPDLLKWAEWFESIDNRRVALTDFPEAHISTVFLGLDHNFGWSDEPLLFETMTFWHSQNPLYKADDGGNCDFGGRCSTWAEAEAMHAETVEQVKLEIAVRKAAQEEA